MRRNGQVLKAIFMVALPVFVCSVSACSFSADAVNNQQAVDNALDADEAVVENAGDRADHLDELASERLHEANATGDIAAAELRNEAAADISEAALIRRGGQVDGVRSEERIEAQAGLINAQ